jgi:glycosyltransferase involved in cell wall biosynthesis
MLADGLVERGHDVTLYATGDSRTKARLRASFQQPVSTGGTVSTGSKGFYDLVHPLATQTISAYLEADRYDIIHDHTGPIAACLGALSDTPVLHTLHGPFNPDVRQFFLTIADKIYFNSISDSQRSGCPELNYVGTIYNAVEVETFPFRSEKGDYALFFGRFSEDKGAHNAIYIAQQANIPLRMAGKVDPGVDAHYFKEHIEPHIDGENIVYEGEVDSKQKLELLAGARFVLFPIQWQEPFGLVMAEALACGTPVVAVAMGAAPEIIEEGEVGVLAGPGEWDEMVTAIKGGLLEDIDPYRCREYVHERFSVEAMLDGYEAAFEKILANSGAASTQENEIVREKSLQS